MFQILLLCAATLQQFLLSAATTGTNIIPNQYIIQLQNDYNLVDLQDHLDYVTQIFGADVIQHTYTELVQYGFTGYSINIPEELVPLLESIQGVLNIEPDQIVNLDGDCVGQSNSIWGLARISENRTYRTGDGFIYNTSSAGYNVDIYVIDSGIYCENNEFTMKLNGSCTYGIDLIDGSNVDGNGHGTHVAGTAAGKTYGVAKFANLIAVRVLDDRGGGSVSDIVNAIDWVIGQSRISGRKSVINLSVGSGQSSSFNSAVEAAVDANIAVAVAAGNSDLNACLYSPSSVEQALVVGATDISDSRASYSNYGDCLDLFAPGSDILSAYIGSPSSTRVLSGTSMASPHVAGVAAQLRSSPQYSSLNSYQIQELLVSMTTSGKLKNVDGDFGTNTISPNKMLYTSCNFTGTFSTSSATSISSLQFSTYLIFIISNAFMIALIAH